jgi:WD40 repeat protein
MPSEVSVYSNLRAPEESVTAVAISADGERIVSASSDDTLKVWDARSGDELLELDHGNEYDITCVAINPDSRWLASVLENFVVYATGRKPDVRDVQQIQTIMQEQAASGCRLGELVKALVRSPIFLDR